MTAFAELVVIHADSVYGALRRFGLEPSEADEVAQEVFLRAWRGLGRFEERAQFSTWLYRIAFNEAQRRLVRRALARVELDPDRDDPIVLLPEAPELGPEAQTLDREFQQVLENNAAAIIQVNVGLNGSERCRHSASVDAARTCRASRTNRSRARS